MHPHFEYLRAICRLRICAVLLSCSTIKWIFKKKKAAENHCSGICACSFISCLNCSGDLLCAMEWKRWLRRFLVAVFWNYQIRILMRDISVIVHIRKHVWFLVFCLHLLLQSVWFSILLSVITPVWDFRQEKQTCMYFQCHNYFNCFSVQVW